MTSATGCRPRRAGRPSAQFFGLYLAGLLLVAVGCSGPQEVAPEVVNVFDGRFAGAAELGDDLWVAVNRNPPSNDPKGADLYLIGADGSTERSVDLQAGAVQPGLHARDGLLWFRDARPLIEFRTQLVSFDPSSDELAYHHAMGTGSWGRFFLVLDDRYWSFGRGTGSYYDLETGESGSFVTPTDPVGPDGVHYDDDFIFLVYRLLVRVMERVTGERVELYRYQDYENGVNVFTRLKYYDGKFWIYSNHGEHNVHEYNLETGEVFNEVPLDRIPTRVFESGGSRWELFNDAFSSAVDDRARSEDRWRRVDLETGRTIGEYDFGQYIPRIVADGYLWLTRLDHDAPIESEATTELARVPLG